jgi:hypothetical protein
LDALKNKDAYEHDDEGLAFIKFFATPIEDLDLMAAKFIEEEEDVSYEKLKKTFM